MGKTMENTVDDRYIVQRIAEHLSRGINADEGDVTDMRQTLFNVYMGAPYGNEREGFSKVVTREGLQAIEWALPSLMRIFLGGIRVVEFKPDGPQDVDQAKLETDVVNGHFFDGNKNSSGFLTLYTFLKDLFMYPNSYMDIDVAEEEEEDTQTFRRVLPGQIDMLREQRPKAKLTQTKVPSDDGVIYYDVVLREDKTDRRIVLGTLPPETCIVDHDHRELSCDGARFVAVRTVETYSDLRKAGYSEDDLADIDNEDEDASWGSEEENRHFYVDEEPTSNDSGQDTLQADKRYVVHRCHMEIDVDGDGISERRRIVMAGRTIIHNEADEYMPIVAGSAMPMPHKHIGMGILEIVEDLQRIMTALTRNLLDNIYNVNIQRTYVSEGAMLSDNSTMDAIMDRTTEVIPVRGRPADGIMPEAITPIVQHIVSAIEVFRDMPQLRTGVAPNLALDPSVLEKSTMGAFVGALEQASQRLEMIGRLVAETVLVPAFQKVHYLLREHFDEPQQVEVNGKWQLVDPRTWRKRSSMKVNVGLGFNNKQIMLTLLKEFLMIQREALGLGLADAKKIYATLEKLTEQANLGHAGTFFNDPNAPGFQPPPPPKDPAMVLAEAQAEGIRAEIGRKDKELALREREVALAEAKANEEAEAKATQLLTAYFGVQGKPAKTQAEIAKLLAEITALNRGDKNQAGPAEDSSADEMAAAGKAMAGDEEPMGEPGSHYGPPKKTTDAPAKPVQKPATNGAAAQ